MKMKLVFRNRVRVLAGALLLSSALLTAQSAAQPKPEFLTDVTVNFGRIRLGDLLAPGASAQLRAVLGSIDLGPAPQPGSLRVFTSAELRHAVVDGQGSALAVDFPPQIIVHRAGWPVASQRIAAALAAAKLPGSNVEILGAPVTRAPYAELEVSAAHPAQDSGALLVRFACRVRSDCNPFWCEIRGLDGIAIPAGERRAARVQSRPEVPLVTPAHPALLICDEPGMEIRLRVRPLKPAGLGERVKVMDPETHRIFFARVKAIDLVESGLVEAR